MAKPNNSHILIPGETSWEIWAAPTSGPATLISEHPVTSPAEINKFPAGDIIFFFPVRALTALPLKVLTTESSLFQDLASTHSERLGLRPDPFAGQLTDVFPLSSNEDSSTLLSIVLRNPRTQDLPTKSAKSFDISPRAFPVTGNTLTLWRELGSWVFALHLDGKLIYCQATSNSAPSPDSSLIREIRIAISQISLQEIDATPSRAIIWTSNPETDTSTLSRSLSVRSELIPRPSPILPKPLSNLLPADVRAARRAAKKRQNITLAAVAIGILYFGAIAYFGFQLWTTQSTTKKLTDRVNAIAPERESYALHIAKWNELEYATSLEYNTVDILHRISRCIPQNSGLRLRTADISPTEITLIGEAPQPQAVNQFSLNLNQSNDLLSYEWQTPAAKESARGWEFNFKANIPTTTP